MTERSCLAFQLPVGLGRPRRSGRILTLYREVLTGIGASAGNAQRNTGP